jgi:ribosomal protein L12E/L44/L45/RPP1/RPP2
MPIESVIRSRIDSLLINGQSLATGDANDQTGTAEQLAECVGWLVSAQNIVHLLCKSSTDAYRLKIDQIVKKEHGWMVHRAVGTVSEILRNLLIDVDAGLLVSISNQARAEVFDDFLDHADAYLSVGRKNEAGAIAGVVFEDSLRRICREVGISEKDVNLDSLISALKAKGELTAIKGKRAAAAAGLRSKATHAQWDEFDEDDVKGAIAFSRELIESKLAG